MFSLLAFLKGSASCLFDAPRSIIFNMILDWNLTSPWPQGWIFDRNIHMYKFFLLECFQFGTKYLKKSLVIRTKECVCLIICYCLQHNVFVFSSVVYTGDRRIIVKIVAHLNLSLGGIYHHRRSTDRFLYSLL